MAFNEKPIVLTSDNVDDENKGFSFKIISLVGSFEDTIEKTVIGF